MAYDFKGKRVFLSGPMTGMPDWNRKAFMDSAQAVFDAGARNLYNPALRAPCGDDPHTHEHWMLTTLHELTRYYEHDGNRKSIYDVFVLLDGWKESEGARVELDVALACGIDAIELGDAL